MAQIASVRRDSSLAVFAFWISLSQLAVILTLPVNLLRVRLAARGGRYLVGFQELVAACHLLIRGHIDENKLLYVRSISDAGSIGRWVLSLPDGARAHHEIVRCQSPHEVLFPEDLAQMPIAERNLGRGIIDSEATGRHA